MLECIVIGAGPGGLVCTKELLEQGVSEVICLEQSGELGGTFAHAYDNLVLTSSATFSMFSDFWIGDGNQHKFWTKKEAVEYWRKYAINFGILDYIRFNSKVVAVTLQKSQQWQVELQSGEILLAKRVALAIGNNNIPAYPSWKNLLVDVEFSHSKEYRNAHNFAGKNVLIVGGGESASDVAFEISHVASKCWVSLRNTTGWVVPRHRKSGTAADISSHRGFWGLPRELGAQLSEILLQFELSKKDPVHDTVAKLNGKVLAKNGMWGTYGTKNLSLPLAIVHHGCQIVGEVVTVEEGGKTLLAADGAHIPQKNEIDR